MIKGKGGHFDPEVAKAFLPIPEEEWITIRDKTTRKDDETDEG